jgi:hypothetical protein
MAEQIPAPEHYGLADVIARLEREDPARRVPLGFACPHSYRGYYDDLAFEMVRDTTVGVMLNSARAAVGATYHGWKGGEYVMGGYTGCWLVAEEGCTGESIGAVLMYLLLAKEADRG